MMGDGQQTIRNQIIGGFVWFSRRFYDSNSSFMRDNYAKFGQGYKITYDNLGSHG